MTTVYRDNGRSAIEVLVTESEEVSRDTQELIYESLGYEVATFLDMRQLFYTPLDYQTTEQYDYENPLTNLEVAISGVSLPVSETAVSTVTYENNVITLDPKLTVVVVCLTTDEAAVISALQSIGLL